jgi:hypothetical protein
MISFISTTPVFSLAGTTGTAGRCPGLMVPGGWCDLCKPGIAGIGRAGFSYG